MKGKSWEWKVFLSSWAVTSTQIRLQQHLRSLWERTASIQMRPGIDLQRRLKNFKVTTVQLRHTFTTLRTSKNCCLSWTHWRVRTRTARTAMGSTRHEHLLATLSSAMECMTTSFTTTSSSESSVCSKYQRNATWHLRVSITGRISMEPSIWSLNCQTQSFLLTIWGSRSSLNF